jgi:glucose/arabinose dehydrogenase
MSSPNESPATQASPSERTSIAPEWPLPTSYSKLLGPIERAEALSRLFVLPGSHFSDPEFSWKYEVAPAAIGFVPGRALGPQFEGDLFMGAVRTTLPPPVQ